MQGSVTGWDFKLLYDGECPLCLREVRLLQRLNRKGGRLALEDIAASDFAASDYGRTLQELMGQIHGVDADGTLVTGMEVFRRSYAAAGWGALASFTGWPVLRPVFDALYRWFARNRLRLTGRSHVCESGRCAVPAK
jgi:predicted DCC family thiol-disulfide oxidoreductase YuxK